MTPFIEMTSLEQFDPDALLSQIECPVLLLQADPEMGAALAEGEEERAMSLIRDSTHVRFDGVGHNIARGDPVRFHRVLFDFLDSLA